MKSSKIETISFVVVAALFILPHLLYLLKISYTDSHMEAIIKQHTLQHGGPPLHHNYT